MEQLSVRSFIANGHDYHLYVYDDVKGVPDGVAIKDANTVLPSSVLIEFRERKDFAIFADLFRYKLLLEHGGWWADSDVICLKQFDFNQEYVFATERDTEGREFVTNGIIKAIIGSDVMARAYEACRSRKPALIRWGETGPLLIHQLVFRTPLCCFVKGANTFCPIDPARFFHAVLPGRIFNFEEETYAVHLWNELWRRHGFDKDSLHASGCLYERLKKLYLL